MGQPARKGQKENYATATACFAWEWVTENSGGSGSLFQTRGRDSVLWGMINTLINTIQFANCILQLKCQIQHLLLAPIFSSIFELNFCKCFHKWRENLWIFLGGEVISSSMAAFHFVSPWYQFCLMELISLLTRNYARKSFHFISRWKQNPVSCSSPKTMDAKLHCVWFACT